MLTIAILLIFISSISFGQGLYNNYIKVRLQSPIKSKNCIRLKSDNGFSIGSWDDHFNEIESLDDNEVNVLLGENNNIEIRNLNGDILFNFTNNDNVCIKSQSTESIISVENSKYRDYISFVRNNNEIMVINIIELEHYLYGVVPAESPSTWPLEALKAQAIAARSYAIKSLNKHISSGYNLCDDVHCQAYKGYDWERESTNKAVDDTRGMILVYNGEVVDAVYHSNSGGHTEYSKNVWGGDVAYLQGKDDPFSTDSPNSNWKLKLSNEDIKSGLNKCGIDIGDILSMKIIDVTEAGRVNSLKIYGTKGETILNKGNIRKVFGSNNLKSTWFVVSNPNAVEEVHLYAIDENSLVPYKVNLNNAYILSKDGTIIGNNNEIYKVKGSNEIVEKKATNANKSDDFIINGKGYGHGVGMSQWGAKKMADLGYSYDQILNYYYTGVNIIMIN